MAANVGESTSSSSVAGDGGGSFECNICFELPQEPIVTLCGHLFCWPCLYKWLHIHSHSPECPVCKAVVEEDKLVPLYGRGKDRVDPRSKNVPGAADIPHRPTGQRPATAPQADPNNHFPNANPNPWFMGGGGGVPLANARWGNYTFSAAFGGLFPLLSFQDNPNADDSNLRPEIWAMGLENPWRCSFDSGRPIHLYCADDVQDQYKVVDLISKGGNYAWVGVYEDQHVGYPPWAAQVIKPTQGIVFPIMGYKVSSSNPENSMESASIVGGYVYRGSADPCLYGRYLFADMYTSAMWTGTDDNGKYTSSSIPSRCSKKTPIPCDESANGPLGPISSFGEDNNLDVFILASQGVYRIVQPTLCGYAHLNSAPTDGVTPSGGSNGMSASMKALVAAVLSVLAAAVAGVVAWRCYFNSTAFCCNGNVQVTNNSTMQGDGPAAKPGPPVVRNVTLKFCPTGGGCCDAADDDAARERFDAMNVKPGGSCDRHLKSIICSVRLHSSFSMFQKCNPFSADLFGIGSTARTVPLLCSSSLAPNYSQPEDHRGDYCEQVWKDCKSTPISNSPFQPRNTALTGSASMLTDFWQSENDFCRSLSGTPNNKSVCFNGHGVSFNTRRNSSPPPTGICLEKIGDGSYLNMVPHPDGSSKAFFSRQDGKIWLATVPEQGMQEGLQIDETSPFLDLSTEGHLSSDLGLVGVAFHPDFANNGRFFVSYICDGTQSPNCGGRCSCDHEVECDPSKLGSDNNGAHPCQYHLVISEYSAEGSPSSFSEATYADPSEVRRVFSMGLPYVSNHAGQLLFGPTDGYLYIFTGNGGIRGDPFNFSQNKKSLLGKIMRLNIDDLPQLNEIANLNLWGNYTIPKDNPNADDSNLRPEIWAMGLENPWRCSFDSGRPIHLYCADDVQDQYKVVDLISKGGNYAWVGVYEDQHVGYPPWAAQVIKPTQGIVFPIMGYKVSSSNPENSMESASIVGGYVYRGSADPCLYGRYLFADMYTSAMWTGTDDNGKYTSSSIPSRCSKKTPIPCDESANGPLGPISSFGEDNNLDVFILASQGVYRIVQPTLCGYAHLNSAPTDGVTPSGGSNGMSASMKALVAAVLSVLAAAVAGVVAWRCYFNSTAFCCNGNVQVTNNSTMQGDGPAAKPGDIEFAMPKPQERPGR
ncbi:hypothetical protein ACQ4PT_047140 [Festuca glaucescens]